jgi:hypothetical protein
MSKFNWRYLQSVSSLNKIYVINLVKLVTGNECT